MRWNKLARQFGKNFGRGNWFYDHLGGIGEKKFDTALNRGKVSRLPARLTPNQKAMAPPERAKIASELRFYQEDFTEERRWAEGVFELLTAKLGAQRSQVVCGVLSGNVSRFSEAVHSHLTRAVEEKRHYLNKEYSHSTYELNPSMVGLVALTCWKDVDDPRQIKLEDVETAIQKWWIWACSGRSQKEIDAEGLQEQHKVRIAAQDASAKTFTRSKKRGVARSIQASNAKTEVLTEAQS